MSNEPVAWMCADEDLAQKGYSRFSRTKGGAWNIPVYTHPVDDTALLRQALDGLESGVPIYPDSLFHRALRERLGETK